MSRHLCIICAVVPVLAVQALAQNGPMLAGSSYHVPPLTFAPGQIVRLQVTGLKTILPLTSDGTTTQRAASVPLPTTLAGISVTVTEYGQQFFMSDLYLVGSWKAPLLSIAQSNNCTTLKAPPFATDCFLTYITAQIPYELQVNLVANPFFYVQVVISENGVDGQAFNAGAVSDRIHVVSTCEDNVYQACKSVVTHADGTQISASSPAQPGEVVVIYAWGLGKTKPVAKTGDLTPAPAPVLALQGGLPGGLAVRFDFSPNASPSALYENPPSATAQAYLTSGQVGLYQINVQLPATFPPVPACQNAVESNLTINLLGVFSFDGAAICVQPAK